MVKYDDVYLVQMVSSYKYKALPLKNYNGGTTGGQRS
jgi:hypothetical protein